MSVVHACAGLLLPRATATGRFIQDFFDLIESNYLPWIPSRYGPHEPPGHTVKSFGRTTFVDYVEDPFIWSAKGGVTGVIWSGLGRSHTAITIWGNPRQFSANAIQSVFRAVAEHEQLDFAYIHILTMAEADAHGSAHRQEITPLNSGFVTKDFEWYIPTLAWCTVVGRPFLEKVPAGVWANAPAAKYANWNECVCFQITDELVDIINNLDRFERARQAIKEHIGMEWFRRPEGVRTDERRFNFVFGE